MARTIPITSIPVWVAKVHETITERDGTVRLNVTDRKGNPRTITVAKRP